MRTSFHALRAAVQGAAVLLLAGVAAAQWAGGQSGVGVPVGDFASPPHEEPVAQGARPGYWLEAFYLYPIGPVYLRSSATFASFAEQEKAFTSVGTVAGFRHDLLSFVVGAELDRVGHAALQPFAHCGGGIFAYCGRAVDVGRARQEEAIASQEFRFKWRVRLGVEVGGGALVAIVPELVQLRMGCTYTMVFSGKFKGFTGYEAGVPLFEYPYPYRADRLGYVRIGLGVTFHLE